MGLLAHIWPAYTTVAVIGMCKNAGKTVTINALVAEVAAQGLVPGLISSGRDGEAVDAVTHQAKPAVAVKEGFYCVTLADLVHADGTSAGLDIIATTGFHTPLGTVVLARVVTPGTVVISGPGSVAKIKHMTDALHAHGAQIVLIDGSIDRKAMSVISDATILASGAAYNRNMPTVVAHTAHTVRLLSLPLAQEDLLDLARTLITTKQTALIDRNGRWEAYTSHTTLSGARLIEERLSNQTAAIVLHGALTAKSLPSKEAPKEISVIVRDATRIFLSAQKLDILTRCGYRFKVLYQAPVVAVTINPYAPDGFHFDAAEFLDAMRFALAPVPVVNVMQACAYTHEKKVTVYAKHAQ